MLTGEIKDERTARGVIAEGSRAAAEGVAGSTQGRAVQQEGLLGSLPVLESADRSCRARCTVRKRRDCSQASGSTCMVITTEKTKS